MYRQRYVIFELAKRDFQSKNKSSNLGSYWGYIEPIVFISILWFVFTVGLRTNPAGEVPFFVYLACGMTPWLLFASTFSTLTSIIKQHAYLVRKGNFGIHLLSISTMFSALVPHVSLLIVVCFINVFHGVYPSLYIFQTIYYLVAMLSLLLGLGWITSSTSVFINDIVNIVKIFIQFGFWLTPIFWNLSLVPAKYHWIVKLNPMFYVVTGYRDSLINKIPFWSKPYETTYFWGVTFVFIFLGTLIFKRLRPHFAEVI